MQLDEEFGGGVNNIFYCNWRLIMRQEKNGRSL